MEDDFREFEAKTVDEAIVQAMKSFSSNFEDLDIQILSEGSKGLFGLVGNKSAKIIARPARVTSQEQDHPTDSAPAEKTSTATVSPHDDSILGDAQEILREILTRMDFPCTIQVKDDKTLEILGDGSGLIIGKRGQTLDSMQFILNRILNKSRQEPVYVTLDTEGYRQRHMSHLKSIAIKMGQKAKRTGQSISLEKMNPYDRRIIHLALKNDSGINTKSVGEGIYKKILIVPRKASK
ncbi:MAG: RNA-binding cell elongation regulator Jag/EloR [Desulfomonilia bacterium]